MSNRMAWVRNPELSRNLGLELTSGRLLWTPLLLLAGIGLCYLPHKPLLDRISMAQGVLLAVWLLGGVVWGGFRAALAVRTERWERTWDAQRLTAMSAGELAVGKVLGAPAHSLYIQLWCLLVWIPTAYARIYLDASDAAWTAFWMVPTVLVLASLALQAAMVAQSFYDGEAGRSAKTTLFAIGMPIVVAIELAVNLFTFTRASGGDSASRIMDEATQEVTKWWGIEISASHFFLFSVIIFLPWAFLGCWRALRRDLQHADFPWAWPAFLLFLVGYVQGFVASNQHDAPWGLLPLVGLGWGLLLTQNLDPMALRQLIEGLRKGPGALALGVPLPWLTLPFLVLVCAAWAVATLVAVELKGKLGFDSTIMVVGVGLLALRDLMLFTWLSCRLPASRQGMGRVALAVVLHGLLPLVSYFAVSSTRLVWPSMGSHASPGDSQEALVGTGLLAVQAVLAWLLLRPLLMRRLREA